MHSTPLAKDAECDTFGQYTVLGSIDVVDQQAEDTYVESDLSLYKNIHDFLVASLESEHRVKILQNKK